MVVANMSRNASTWVTCYVPRQELSCLGNEILEGIDEAFLRQLFGAHSKTPIEALYLKSGKIPIRYIINKTKGLKLHRHDLSIKNKEIYQKYENIPKNLEIYPKVQKYTKKLKI